MRVKDLLKSLSGELTIIIELLYEEKRIDLFWLFKMDVDHL